MTSCMSIKHCLITDKHNALAGNFAEMLTEFQESLHRESLQSIRNKVIIKRPGAVTYRSDVQSVFPGNNWEQYNTSGGVTTSFSKTQLPRHRFQKHESIAKTFRNRLRQDKTRLRLIQVLETQDIARYMRQDMRRIRLRRDWDTMKIFETEKLPWYSYQDPL